MIERKTGAAGIYVPIAIVPPDTTVFANIGLSPGTTYYYRIKASNMMGDSPYSNETNAATLLPRSQRAQIAAGGSHSVYLGMDGVLGAWGDNDTGRWATGPR